MGEWEGFIPFQCEWLREKNRGRRVLSFSFEIPEAFNRRLSQIILSKEAELIQKFQPSPGPPGHLHLTSRWKKYNVLTWGHPECFYLRQMIRAGMNRFYPTPIKGRFRFIQCWANILRRGEAFDLHAHGPHQEVISGTYYPSAGDAGADSGATYFAINSKKRNPFVPLVPQTGNMNLFKGNIPHFVSQYNGDEPRISIAWDITSLPIQGNSFVPL